MKTNRSVTDVNGEREREGVVYYKIMEDLFRLAPTVRYAHAPPPKLNKAHVSLHSKSLCKNMACTSGGGEGANNIHPLRWGHKRKRSNMEIGLTHQHKCSPKIWGRGDKSQRMK